MLRKVQEQKRLICIWYKINDDNDAGFVKFLYEAILNLLLTKLSFADKSKFACAVFHKPVTGHVAGINTVIYIWRLWTWARGQFVKLRPGSISRVRTIQPIRFVVTPWQTSSTKANPGFVISEIYLHQIGGELYSLNCKLNSQNRCSVESKFNVILIFSWEVEEQKNLNTKNFYALPWNSFWTMKETTTYRPHRLTANEYQEISFKNEKLRTVLCFGKSWIPLDQECWRGLLWCSHKMFLQNFETL